MAIPEGLSPLSTHGYTIPPVTEQQGVFTAHQVLLTLIKNKLCGGNAAELARRIGKDPTYVNRLFYLPGKSGRKGIGLEIMEACTRAFSLPPGFWESDPGTIRIEDLRRPATGPLIAGEAPAAYGMEPILAWEHPDDLPDGEFVMVPRLDVHLSAGSGREQVEIDLVKENPQAFRAEWIRLMRLKPAKLAAMRASGDSMEPTIHDGDSLLVDTSQTTVVDGKVYALWYDGGERVKRLFRLPGGGLRIKSDNPAFDTIEVPPGSIETVRLIGRIVHRSGTGGL